MFQLKTITPLTLVLILSGCALQPPAAPTPIKLPEQYVQGLNQAKEQAPDLTAWWDHYQDPELVRLVRMASDHNQDIAMTLARYDKALAVLGQAQASELPQVSVGAGSSKESSNTNDLRTQTTTHNVSGLASFELNMWGKLSNATSANEKSAGAALHNTVSTQNLIRNSVITQYWSIRQLDAEKRVLDQQIEAREKQLKISKKQLSYGITSELDVQQARADLASLERNRITTKTNRENLVQSLAILVGAPDLKIATGGDVPQPLATPALGIPSLLLQQRPDVMQAENEMSAAGFDVAVARAAMFPSISLTAQGGGRSGTLSNLVGAGSSFWTLGYTLDLPIFDGGLRLAQIDQAKASQREKAAQYQKSIMTAFSDVNQALITADGWNKQTPWMQDELEAARKAMDFARRKYEFGSIDYSTVLDTQKTYLDAQRADVAIRYGKLISQANLYYALGR